MNNSEQLTAVPRPKRRLCLWCRTDFELRQGPGRRKIYCKVSCRQLPSAAVSGRTNVAEALEYSPRRNSSSLGRVARLGTFPTE